MFNIFLHALNVTGNFSSGEFMKTVAPAVVAVLIAFFFFIMFLLVAVYVYSSFAYMAIAKKAKHPLPGLVWIPLVGKPLVTSQIAKMHWWPILFLGLGVLTFNEFGIVLFWMGMIALEVFIYIWRWKTYEVVKHPGWFSLLFLFPVVGLVFLGIVAWSKEGSIEPIKKRKK